MKHWTENGRSLFQLWREILTRSQVSRNTLQPMIKDIQSTLTIENATKKDANFAVFSVQGGGLIGHVHNKIP